MYRFPLESSACVTHRSQARDAGSFLTFFLPGLGISSWVTRTPDVRDLVEASTAQMGLILFGLSIGSMVGILGSGALVARWGTRAIIGAGIACVAVGVAVIGGGAGLGSGPVVASASRGCSGSAWAAPRSR